MLILPENRQLANKNTTIIHVFFENMCMPQRKIKLFAKIRWGITSHDTLLPIYIMAIAVWKANKSNIVHCWPQ